MKPPIDEQIGTILAAQIRDNLPQGSESKVESVTFTYDTNVDLDSLTRKSVIMVSPFDLEETRESRSDWSVDLSLLLTFMVKAGSDENPTWFGGYLSLWDSIVATTRENGLVSSIESQGGRYRIDQTANHKRLITQKTIILEKQDPAKWA